MSVSLALAVGLSRLVARRAGTAIRTLVIDEPDGLDADARRAFGQALRVLAHQGELERVVLVSHHPDLAEYADEVYQVTKNGRGVEGAATPDDLYELGNPLDENCRAEVQTPGAALICSRRPHVDDLHWDAAYNDGDGVAWRLHLDVKAATVEQVETMLTLVLPEDKRPSAAAIAGWDQATRDEVAEWASAVHLRASDHDDVVVPPEPAVISAIEGPIADANSDELEHSAADDELLPGGPALECHGSVHVPGCEHMGGVVPIRGRHA
jgi:energy-coupling factor transporter ATP-binding protein EcfA2